MRKGSWQHATLGTLVAARGKNVDPSKQANDIFELYSVPSFPDRNPEIIAGKEIGSNKQQVHPRSVLLCKINPRINRAWIVGNASKYPKIASTEWIIFPEQEGIEPSFLCYFLQQNAVRDFLAANASGVGGSLMRVKPSTLRDFPFAYPERDEQQRIVAEIEKQFTRLDAGVASLKRVQTALKRYRASVLKAAYEGRLVPTEAELACKENRSYESADVLLQRILKQRHDGWNGNGKHREPLSAKVFDLPQLPEGWTWATAEQLTDENRSITYGVIKLGAPVPNGVYVLRSSDVRHLRLDLEDVKQVAPDIAGEYRRTFLKGGEVLITVRGTLGGVVVAPAECAGFNISREIAMLAMVEPAVAKIVAIFIGSAPLQRWLLQRAKGIAYTGINIETLKEIPIPLPPLAEQTRIVAEVERRLSVVVELEAVVSANLQRATRLRQSILQKAFMGQLGNSSS
jgi:type I restriction enzyme, S subunit